MSIAAAAPLPDVRVVCVSEAQMRLPELLRWARLPGHYVLIRHRHDPARQVWLGTGPPPGWEDDSPRMAEVYRQQQRQATEDARHRAAAAQQRDGTGRFAPRAALAGRTV